MHHWRSANLNEHLLNAFNTIPRENFVPPSLRERAYEDKPLPTLRGQSISQPTTVMVMLDALEVKEGDKIFEVGSGAGYQAALLSQLVGTSGTVISTEVVPELVTLAKKNMNDLNLTNVDILEIDGSEGDPVNGPFDKIIITAACPTIPQPLIDQLKENGIIVAPVGDLKSQTMIKGTKSGERLELDFIGPFQFVPMKGKHGFKETELFND
tara:strand:- start:3004 stop:3636 length:633 start_codon:yes stop_codon:yes gene_type:complete